MSADDTDHHDIVALDELVTQLVSKTIETPLRRISSTSFSGSGILARTDGGIKEVTFQVDAMEDSLRVSMDGVWLGAISKTTIPEPTDTLRLAYDQRGGIQLQGLTYDSDAGRVPLFLRPAAHKLPALPASSDEKAGFKVDTVAQRVEQRASAPLPPQAPPAPQESELDKLVRTYQPQFNLRLLQASIKEGIVMGNNVRGEDWKAHYLDTVRVPDIERHLHLSPNVAHVLLSRLPSGLVHDDDPGQYVLPLTLAFSSPFMPPRASVSTKANHLLTSVLSDQPDDDGSMAFLDEREKDNAARALLSGFLQTMNDAERRTSLLGQLDYLAEQDVQKLMIREGIGPDGYDGIGELSHHAVLGMVPRELADAWVEGYQRTGSIDGAREALPTPLPPPKVEPMKVNVPFTVFEGGKAEPRREKSTDGWQELEIDDADGEGDSDIEDTLRDDNISIEDDIAEDIAELKEDRRQSLEDIAADAAPEADSAGAVPAALPRPERPKAYDPERVVSEVWIVYRVLQQIGAPVGNNKDYTAAHKAVFPNDDTAPRPVRTHGKQRFYRVGDFTNKHFAEFQEAYGEKEFSAKTILTDPATRAWRHDELVSETSIIAMLGVQRGLAQKLLERAGVKPAVKKARLTQYRIGDIHEVLGLPGWIEEEEPEKTPPVQERGEEPARLEELAGTAVPEQEMPQPTRAAGEQEVSRLWVTYRLGVSPADTAGIAQVKKVVFDANNLHHHRRDGKAEYYQASQFRDEHFAEWNHIVGTHYTVADVVHNPYYHAWNPDDEITARVVALQRGIRITSASALLNTSWEPVRTGKKNNKYFRRGDVHDKLGMPGWLDEAVAKEQEEHQDDTEASPSAQELPSDELDERVAQASPAQQTLPLERIVEPEHHLQHSIVPTEQPPHLELTVGVAPSAAWYANGVLPIPSQQLFNTEGTWDRQKSKELLEQGVAYTVSFGDKSRSYVAFLTPDNLPAFFRDWTTEAYRELEQRITGSQFAEVAQKPFGVFNVSSLRSLDFAHTGSSRIVKEIEADHAHLIPSTRDTIFIISEENANYFVPYQDPKRAEQLREVIRQQYAAFTSWQPPAGAGEQGGAMPDVVQQSKRTTYYPANEQREAPEQPPAERLPTSRLEEVLQQQPHPQAVPSRPTMLPSPPPISPEPAAMLKKKPDYSFERVFMTKPMAHDTEDNRGAIDRTVHAYQSEYNRRFMAKLIETGVVDGASVRVGTGDVPYGSALSIDRIAALLGKSQQSVTRKINDLPKDVVRHDQTTRTLAPLAALALYHPIQDRKLEDPCTLDEVAEHLLLTAEDTGIQDYLRTAGVVSDDPDDTLSYQSFCAISKGLAMHWMRTVSDSLDLQNLMVSLGFVGRKEHEKMPPSEQEAYDPTRLVLGRIGRNHTPAGLTVPSHQQPPVEGKASRTPDAPLTATRFENAAAPSLESTVALAERGTVGDTAEELKSPAWYSDGVLPVFSSSLANLQGSERRDAIQGNVYQGIAYAVSFGGQSKTYVLFLTPDNLPAFFSDRTTRAYQQIEQQLRERAFNKLAEKPFGVFNTASLGEHDFAIISSKWINAAIEQSGAYTIPSDRGTFFVITEDNAHYFVPRQNEEKAEQLREVIRGQYQAFTSWRPGRRTETKTAIAAGRNRETVPVSGYEMDTGKEESSITVSSGIDKEGEEPDESIDSIVAGERDAPSSHQPLALDAHPAQEQYVPSPAAQPTRRGFEYGGESQDEAITRVASAYRELYARRFMAHLLETGRVKGNRVIIGEANMNYGIARSSEDIAQLLGKPTQSVGRKMARLPAHLVERKGAMLFLSPLAALMMYVPGENKKPEDLLLLDDIAPHLLLRKGEDNGMERYLHSSGIATDDKMEYRHFCTLYNSLAVSWMKTIRNDASRQAILRSLGFATRQEYDTMTASQQKGYDEAKIVLDMISRKEGIVWQEQPAVEEAKEAAPSPLSPADAETTVREYGVPRQPSAGREETGSDAKTRLRSIDDVAGATDTPASRDETTPKIRFLRYAGETKAEALGMVVRAYQEVFNARHVEASRANGNFNGYAIRTGGKMKRYDKSLSIADVAEAYEKTAMNTHAIITTLQKEHRDIVQITTEGPRITPHAAAALFPPIPTSEQGNPVPFSIAKLHLHVRDEDQELATYLRLATLLQDGRVTEVMVYDDFCALHRQLGLNFARIMNDEEQRKAFLGSNGYLHRSDAEQQLIAAGVPEDKIKFTINNSLLSDILFDHVRKDAVDEYVAGQRSR